MILADTSAWVEHDRATGSAVDLRLSDLLADRSEVAHTEVVRMEVLAGARDDLREEQLRRLLARAHFLPIDAVVDFEAAATIYRRCRRAGVTPRGLLDCLVAAVAKRTGAVLLHHDADLARMARVIDLPCDEASLRP